MIVLATSRSPRRFPAPVALPAVLAAIVGCACSRPRARTAAPHSAAASASQVTRATLDNGLRVVVVRNRLAPVATMEINYLVGSREVPAKFPGTAHAQEHMMFRGSPGLSAGQLADITAALGGDVNAETGPTVTQYFMTVPAEDLDVALHVGAIRMRGVLDSEASWEKERGAIEQEVAADLSNPSYVLYTRLLAALFADTPYAYDALGTRPSFDKTTGAMLEAFYEAWYVPNNAILVVAGDVDPAHVLAEVKRLYGDIPRKPIPERPEIVLQPVVPQTLEMKTDQPYGFVALAFRVPGFASPDYAATQVLEDVLSNRRGPLYALVPEGKALDAGFETQLFPEAGIGFAVALFPKGADAAALARELKAALAGALKAGFSPDLVAAARRREATQLELQKNSVSGLASAWSDALAVEGRRSPDDDLRAIQAVTAARVNRVAREYLNLDRAVEAILTPQPSGAPVSPRGFGGQESFAPTATEAVTLPAWASEALSQLSVPRSVVHPVVSTLPNGLRLIVQRETVSDTVSVHGRIKSQEQLETPEGKEGVADILDRLFEFGTASLDRVAFQKALDDIGASETAGTDFSVQTLASHFDRAVELLADNELRPALPARAFQVVRTQVAQSVAGRNQSPGYLARRALTLHLVPRGDPAGRQATPTSVSAVSLDDVKAYYRTVFRPDLTTIVVIGNVDPARARAVIEKSFGSWQAKGPAPATDLPPIPLNRAAVVAVPDRARSQDQVVLAETLGLTRRNPDYYALELGNHVLGGGFYATRLYHHLREQAGLVYFVKSDFDIGKTRGTYRLSYGCDPPNVARARSIAVRDLAAMGKAPVSRRELDQAKGILLRDLPLHESSVEAIAEGLIRRSLEDLPLDEPTRAARRYLSMSAEQVRAAFARWVDPSRLVQVTQGPPPG